MPRRRSTPPACRMIRRLADEVRRYCLDNPSGRAVVVLLILEAVL